MKSQAMSNMKLIKSDKVVKFLQRFKSDNHRHHFFMEHCNGGTLDQFLKLRQHSLDDASIQKILDHVRQALNDMQAARVHHGNLSTTSLKLHFPDWPMLDKASESQRKQFLENVDLRRTRWHLKVADFEQSIVSRGEAQCDLDALSEIKSRLMAAPNSIRSIIQ